MKLKELIMDRNTFEGKKIRILRETLLNNSALDTLSMNNCGLGPDGAHIIALGLMKNKRLKNLYISNNDIGDEGMKHFGEAIQMYSFPLETLDLSSNNIGDKGGVIFARNFCNN
jgi:Ran GTPase-activating protein (RanGAP) involved in mRNA processing and transport